MLAMLLAIFVAASVVTAWPWPHASGHPPCSTVEAGYQCRPDLSRYWGQYSPYFTVESEIPDVLPEQCQITFVQILSRHGARDPTSSKTEVYNATISRIHANAQSYTREFAFLEDYEYNLGADQLTLFGEQQMVDSGEQRVVQSAENFAQGFHAAKLAARCRDPAYPYPLVVIPEGDGTNNTLNHALCTDFEDGPVDKIADDAQAAWAAIFATPIQARLNDDMPGANLSVIETVYMMDLCPFETVAHPTGAISQFCDLFTEQEWHQYNYYETLDKYYGYSHGNPLGPTQGVGFAKELIARLTNTPVREGASTNRTLDESNTTFPLGRQLYADFSHDNDMTAIFSALGLYNTTVALPNTTIVEAPQADGYSAAWTASFAARAYFEKMTCQGHDEELVRILVNDRVQPLTQCGADHMGRCTLSAFIDSLDFVKADVSMDLFVKRIY
ncbi:acid phosphatase [Hortaea werneckii]|nr:acid phosphatase [Hortaea werneckii]KAI6815911.1 acid phosphatase [Hortaea werneckii]KAI6916159.1 acid phosphatase [Hortaea werneckii]KAI6929058.1 acid phosphatase [Hortaea werneckii]KAI6954331.1 acid phosphatase [Hortaea werneckii]